jgi:hypothetical protein
MNAFVDRGPPCCHLNIVTWPFNILFVSGVALHIAFPRLPASVQTDRHSRLDRQLLYFGLASSTMLNLHI